MPGIWRGWPSAGSGAVAMAPDALPTTSGSLSIYVVEIGLNGFLVRAVNEDHALRLARARDDFPDTSWRAEPPLIKRIHVSASAGVCHGWTNAP